jgi:hypothetical protein
MQEEGKDIFPPFLYGIFRANWTTAGGPKRKPSVNASVGDDRQI